LDWSVKDIQTLLDTYEGMGPIVAVSLPFLEAFFPILPLFAIVAGNAAAFGLWPGFIYTWIGACSGSILTFWLVRKLGRKWTSALFKYKSIEKTSHWLEKHGFSVLFILRCLPFSPSSLINVMAGISALPFHTYFWATVLGKSVMIFILSFIGYDLPKLIHEPWKLVLITAFIVILWFIGKKVERHYLVHTK